MQRLRDPQLKWSLGRSWWPPGQAPGPGSWQEDLWPCCQQTLTTAGWPPSALGSTSCPNRTCTGSTHSMPLPPSQLSPRHQETALFPYSELCCLVVDLSPNCPLVLISQMMRQTQKGGDSPKTPQVGLEERSLQIDEWEKDRQRKETDIGSWGIRDDCSPGNRQQWVISEPLQSPTSHLSNVSNSYTCFKTPSYVSSMCSFP